MVEKSFLLLKLNPPPIWVISEEKEKEAKELMVKSVAHNFMMGLKKEASIEDKIKSKLLRWRHGQKTAAVKTDQEKEEVASSLNNSVINCLQSDISIKYTISIILYSFCEQENY